MHDLSARELRAGLAAGRLRSEEIVAHLLQRIEALDSDYGAFATVTADRALDAARRADAERDAGRAHGALHGLPLADKDLTARRGVVTGFGSRLAGDEPATHDDEIVRRLDAAGAISLGKTQTPEFGMTAYTRNLRGRVPTRNPYDPARDPGGSSGGAAVAVSARLLPFAPGSDGGGSIRIPASATGLVGLKPGRGRIPDGRGDARPDDVTRLTVPGALARDAADAALLFGALVDPLGDPTRLVSAAATPPRTALRIGVLTSSPWDTRYAIEIDPAVRSALDRAIGWLTHAGHDVQQIALPDASAYPDAFTTLWQSIAAELPAAGREERLEPFTRWLWRGGRALAPGALDHAVVQLQRFTRDVTAALSPWDAVLSPTLAMLPVPIDWFSRDDPEANFAQQCRFSPFTSFVNVTGLPAISVPVGLAESAERPPLPIGMQFIGRTGSEELLLSLAAFVEEALPPARTPADRPG